MADNSDKGLSRRSFLKGIPIGIAGAFALTALVGRFGQRSQDNYPTFPEGSIFTPAKDRRDV